MPRTAIPDVKTNERKAGAGLAKFLKSIYHTAGWSRAEAARRAKISEGYLCHLFAGDVQLPRSELFRSLVDGWNFNPLDLFRAAGYVTEEDIDKYYRRNRATIDSTTRLDPEIQAIVDALMQMSPEEREMKVPVMKALLLNGPRTVAQETRRRRQAVGV